MQIQEELKRFKIARANELALLNLKDCYPEDGLKTEGNDIYSLNYWLKRVRLSKNEKLVFGI
ncbi:MAG: hypothetical protein KGI08_11255 [Thaumarchaeota archaeon]|nr:hypothetical protein [Nitrososphaerota archaeon]